MENVLRNLTLLLPIKTRLLYLFLQLSELQLWQTIAYLYKA